MITWFGEDWGAPVCRTTQQVPVPVGRTCLWCDEPVAATDSGVITPLVENAAPGITAISAAYYHLECWGRQMFGSTGHQLKLCPCFGGDYEGEPETMSRRDAARAAWEMARQRAPQP